MAMIKNKKEERMENIVINASTIWQIVLVFILIAGTILFKVKGNAVGLLLTLLWCTVGYIVLLVADIFNALGATKTLLVLAISITVLLVLCKAVIVIANRYAYTHKNNTGPVLCGEHIQNG